MREIKFRIFDKQEEEFLNEEDYAINFVGTIFKACLDEEVFEVLDADMYIVTQYTGLFDKQGTEIYEGDILKINTKDDQWITKVGNSGVWYEIKIENLDIDFLPIDYAYDVLDCDIEVIGNIYENKDLLDNN